MEQVAAMAGVGKGTVFHRFGSRMGLMRALMVERTRSVEQAVTTGPPPVLDQLATDGPKRFSAAMRALACAVLDAPAG